MATNQGTETLTVTSEERTWRINIETAKSADPVVTAFRETVRTAANGSIISKADCGTTTRALSAVATQSFTVGGHSYTTAEIAAVVAAIADTWRQEDAVAEADRFAAEQQRMGITASPPSPAASSAARTTRSTTAKSKPERKSR